MFLSQSPVRGHTTPANYNTTEREREPLQSQTEKEKKLSYKLRYIKIKTEI